MWINEEENIFKVLKGSPTILTLGDVTDGGWSDRFDCAKARVPDVKDTSSLGFIKTQALKCVESLIKLRDL